MTGLRSMVAGAWGVPMPRSVVPETLDALDAHDPVAERVRRDLRRIHRAMRTRSILVRALAGLFRAARSRPLRLLELGAGDGTLMLDVARAMAPVRSEVQFVLLDRQPCVDAATLDRYASLGWHAVPVVTEVADWIASDNAQVDGAMPLRWDLIIANLFLHHFKGRALGEMLDAVARRTDRFFACEPRRAGFALLASHLVRAIGASAVTRHDAVASVRAGFTGNELSASWPARQGWSLREYGAGPFSHCFDATRQVGNANGL